MRAAAVILARAGSKGVAGKNLRTLAGRTLLERAVAGARACPSVARVLVCSDGGDILEAARGLGAETLAQPPELARDDSPRWPVWKLIMERLDAGGGPAFDALADIQIPSPFRRPEDVEGCLRVLGETGADAVLTVYPSERNPYFNMVEFKGPFIELIGKLPARPSTRQAAPEAFGVSTICFAVRADFARRGVHVLDGRAAGYVVPAERALDIDTPLDLEFAEFLAARHPELLAA